MVQALQLYLLKCALFGRSLRCPWGQGLFIEVREMDGGTVHSCENTRVTARTTNKLDGLTWFGVEGAKFLHSGN
jgi:hypothetical protein